MYQQAPVEALSTVPTRARSLFSKARYEASASNMRRRNIEQQAEQDVIQQQRSERQRITGKSKPSKC